MMEYVIFGVVLVQLLVTWRFMLDHRETETRQEKRIDQNFDLINKVVEAQALFAPAIEQISSTVQDLWESRQTRAQVLSDHKSQSEKLDKIVEQTKQV